MPFYFNGSTLSLTILTVSKIYLMMRIKGDVSFQRHRISQLNITYLIIVFLVHLLGMFSHIQYMQSSSLIFRKCSKYFKCLKLLPTTLEQKRKLWLWSIWFQIVNSVSWLSSKKNVTLLSYDYNTGFGTKILDTSSVAQV